MYDKALSLNIILLAAALAVSGCQSNPSRSSAAASGGTPPSSSSPSSSPTSASGRAQATGGESAQNKNKSKGRADTKIGARDAAAAGQQQGQAAAAAPTDAPTGAQADEEAGEKTDEQILAEALDALATHGNKNQTAPSSNHGQKRPPGQKPVAGKGAVTDAEKSAELDRRLGDQFAEFDDLILSEREAARREGSGTAADELGNVENADADADADGDSADNSPPLQTAAAQPPSPSGGRLNASRAGDSVSYEVPDDVGQGQDDDIIARQLREAAMKEQDPELRARLWDEYRKYKKSS